MIELARSQERVHRLGIDYSVGDARDLQFVDQFGLVVAAYLLNYARDRQELAAMCRGIARCLKPGGRFVTVNSNPGLDFSAAPSFRKYGFETSVAGPFQEGAPITWRMAASKSKTITWTPPRMRRHCALQAFARFAGTYRGYRRGQRPNTAATFGPASSKIVP